MVAGRHIEQSAAYAWGLASPAEVLAMVRQQRDALLLEAVVPVLEAALAAPTAADDSAPQPTQGGMNRALQHIADLAALCDSLPALDDYTSSTVRSAAIPHSAHLMSKWVFMAGHAMHVAPPSAFGVHALLRSEDTAPSATIIWPDRGIRSLRGCHAFATG